MNKSVLEVIVIKVNFMESKHIKLSETGGKIFQVIFSGNAISPPVSSLKSPVSCMFTFFNHKLIINYCTL